MMKFVKRYCKIWDCMLYWVCYIIFIIMELFYFVTEITKCTLVKAYTLTNQLCDSVTSDKYGVATFSQGCMFFGA